MQIVDLSQPIETGMQVFPGDPQVRSTAVAHVELDGFEVAELHLGTHSGTHLDAPAHTIAGGAGIDRLELSALMGTARIVRIPAVSDQIIQWADVSSQLEDVSSGTIVIFHTGWSRFFGTPTYLQHPVLDAGIAERLVEAGVKVVGVDTLNPDRTPSEAASTPIELPVHEVILGAGGAIVENLTNLEAVTWPDPVFSALPLRLSGLDGSPVRAVALQY